MDKYFKKIRLCKGSNFARKIIHTLNHSYSKNITMSEVFDEMKIGKRVCADMYNDFMIIEGKGGIVDTNYIIVNSDRSFTIESTFRPMIGMKGTLH